MKIIEPSVELIDFVDGEALKKIERCGRVCYRSQPKDDSAEKFVRMLIKRGHESVLEHVNLTFHIICDRAIQNEFVRHRHASFSVESTRYVKYNELEVIAPDFPNKESFVYRKWYSAMCEAEDCYRQLIDAGAKPEDARSVLPLCTKSELYMTANLREWRHILRLRTDKRAHPQIRFIAKKILGIFKEKLPVIVEDLNA